MPSAERVVRIDLDDHSQSEAAQKSLRTLFRGKVDIITSEPASARVRVLPIERLPSAKPRDEIVAVGEVELPELVSELSSRPWLNHVVSPQVLDAGLWGTTIAGALWELLGANRRFSLTPFLGKDFKGRQATIRDSKKREGRIDAIADLARASGASSALVERIRDVSEELLTNAIYDAPAERHGRPIDRNERVRLPREEACQLTYGVARQTFFVRVRDNFGELTRKRLVSVLSRCAAREDVEFDTSRGGAGLGMWRIFSSASLIVMRVQPREFTDIIVGIDIQRGRRWQRGRAIHLFFQDSEKEVRS